MVLLARDPVFGHAYWEVPADRISRARFDVGGNARGVLRLIDAEHDAWIANFEVNPERGRYVFRFPESDRRYYLELGVQGANGHLLILHRSNIAAAPPSSGRAKGDVVFVGLEAQRAVLSRAHDLEQPPRLAVELQDPARARKPGRLRTSENAHLFLAADARELDSTRKYFQDGGSEPRLFPSK